MKKYYLGLIISIVLGFLFVFVNDTAFNFVKKNIPYELKLYVKEKLLKNDYKLIKKQLTILEDQNKILYNQLFLPETQFLNLDFKTIKLDFINTEFQPYQKTQVKKFFLEKLDNNLLINSQDEFYVMEEFNLEKINKIPTNLKKFDIDSNLDISIVENFLFLSIKEKKSSDCNSLKILFAEINYSYLNFKNFYHFDECLINILGGRIKKYTFNGENGLLITTGSYGEENPFLPQDDKSYYGKIIFLNLHNPIPKIFSKGHRNPQGLFVGRNLILSTEHGDYGGDEINKIIYNNNYGYPISSYGENYNFKEKVLKNQKSFEFLKNHKTKNFKEPIFSFVPSIGISEIVEVPETFSKYWKNNFIISSLNARSLYRVQFDSNYDKILYYEKIFLGERIRDLFFDEINNKIYLALEDTGSLGIISIKN